MPWSPIILHFCCSKYIAAYQKQGFYKHILYLVYVCNLPFVFHLLFFLLFGHFSHSQPNWCYCYNFFSVQFLHCTHRHNFYDPRNWIIVSWISDQYTPLQISSNICQLWAEKNPTQGFFFRKKHWTILQLLKVLFQILWAIDDPVWVSEMHSGVFKSKLNKPFLQFCQIF